jgi:glycosyltransferase involved in cell wall biosynthesis
MGGCENYRFRIPFQQVRENVNGACLDWAPVKAVRRWAANGNGFKTRPTDYDVWLMPRHRPLPYGADGTSRFDEIPSDLKQGVQKMGVELEGEAHLLDLVRVVKKKVAVVLEYDDDHWGSRDLGHMEHVHLARQLLKEADAITVSTPYLKELVGSYAPGVPVYVLPNVVNMGEWQGWERWKRWDPEWTVLGLTGSITHYDDWIVLKDVLPRIMREYGNVAFLLQGFIPDYLENVVGQYPGRVYADEYFRDYNEYPGVIRQSDITLCPVDPDDKFNLAKSSVKAIEGMAAGRPLSDGKTGGSAVIASPTNYYGKVVGWGSKRGIVADHDPDSWYRAITDLIKDKGKREAYQRKGWIWVDQNRSIERKWKLWWSAYQEIYRRKRYE